MVIYPAIDIKDGKCVRLVQGRAEDETIFSDDPVETARRWVKSGASFIHVVDLDGAFDGESPNMEIIKTIASVIPVPIQLGGGIRTMEKIEMMLDSFGVERVIIGTAAIEEPGLLKQAVDRYGSRIAVGIDAESGMVAIKGWVEKTDIRAVDLGLEIKKAGIETIIYTDISKDGMMIGPNLAETSEMIEKTGLNVIASGGISSLNDVRAVKEIGAAGVIIGKALYTGAFSLESALEIGDQEQISNW